MASESFDRIPRELRELEDKRITPFEKLVWAYLSNALERGQGRLSVSYVAKRVRISRNRATKAIANLEAAGLLRVEGQGAGRRLLFETLSPWKTCARGEQVSSAEPAQGVSRSDDGTCARGEQVTCARGEQVPAQGVSRSPAHGVSNKDTARRSLGDSKENAAAARAREVFDSFRLWAKTKGLPIGARLSKKHHGVILDLLAEGIDFTEADFDAFGEAMHGRTIEKSALGLYLHNAGGWAEELAAKRRGPSRGPAKASRFVQVEPDEVQEARAFGGDLEAAWAAALERDPTIKRPTEVAHA